jgi:hypothetical protein
LDNKLEHFLLPLSDRANDELLQLSSWLEGIQLNLDRHDEWKIAWKNGDFFASKFYNFSMSLFKYVRYIKGFGRVSA